MMNFRKYISSLFFLVVLFSCSYEFPQSESYKKEDLGNINTDKMVYAGDEYLSGFMDGALYNNGQKNSAASIIADQINIIQKVEFVQPEINSTNGLNLYASKENKIFGKWIYEFSDFTADIPQLKLTDGESVIDFSGDRNTLTDFSIPMVRMNQVNNSELTKNPYFNRIYTQPGNTYKTEISKEKPTFVILWLGMNDILDFAIHGANGNDNFDGDDIDRNWNLTSVENFRTNFDDLTDALIQNEDCRMVIGNFISIQSLPFFYVQTYDALFLEGTKLSAARARYKEFNNAVAIYNRTVPDELKRPFIDFYDNGSNPHPQPLVVIDSSLTDAQYPDGRELEKYRQLDKNELLLFNVSDEMIELGYGSVIPLNDENYLTESKIDLIEKRISDFNSVLIEKSNLYPERITIADINTPVRSIAETGKTDAWGDPISKEIIYFNGVPVEGSLGMNSIFSLDGLHFNQRGNAFIANVFIDAINRGFGARLPKVDINKYVGNEYTFSY